MISVNKLHQKICYDAEYIIKYTLVVYNSNLEMERPHV